MTRVRNDPDVSTLVRRGRTLAIHSTAAFAREHKHTMGGAQHTSLANGVTGTTAGRGAGN